MMKRSMIAVTVVLMTLTSTARKFDRNGFGRAMHEVQRTVNQIERTVDHASGGTYSIPPQKSSFDDNLPPPQMELTPTYTSEPVSVQPSESRLPSESRFKTKLGFRERMGPVARCLNNALEWVRDRAIRPVAEWVKSLERNQRTLFLVLLGAVVFVPLLIGIIVARREEDSLMASKGAAGCSAIAGAIFTVWGGFEIGGSVGEWLTGAIMALMGLSALLAVIGGLWSGKSVIFKVFAPFMLLEMSLVVFLLAMMVTAVFIMIAIVIIVLSVVASAADSNTIYRCPDCGRTFRGKPSSCPCGAQFA